MPELPEVATIAATLRPQLVGRTITGVTILLPKTFAAGNEYRGTAFPATVLNVRRRAKLLLVDLEPCAGGTSSPYILAFHLKMTGQVFVHAATVPPTPHTRLVFPLAGTPSAQTANLFFEDMRTFGYCRLMRPEDLALWPFWNTLGPEPLTLAPEELSAILGKSARALKALLLDQTVIVGIGNIYADEACFRAGIHPATPANRIPPQVRETLCAAIKAVLTESIEQCGSSIRDYRDANGNAGAFQNFFQVYGRAGQPCFLCGNSLAKARIATRTTVFCPRCQQRW